MAINNWGLIYLGMGDEDPAVDRTVVDRGGLTTTIVAVSDRADSVRAAEHLVAAGAQLIELCGAFGPHWVAEVTAAVGDRVPVGGVMYGAENAPALAELFAPAAA